MYFALALGFIGIILCICIDIFLHLTYGTESVEDEE